MESIRQSPDRVKPGVDGARTHTADPGHLAAHSARHTPGDEPTPPHGQAVGYDFDPLPSTIRRDILLDLKPIDYPVLAILISFAVWRRDSCWTTIKIVAARLRAIRPGRSHKATACERTVQRSIERLKAAGLIEHRRVAKPDPDQPENRTGWRFFFLWPIEVRPLPPREVTKAPREVTKEAPSPATPSRPAQSQVTMESGDYGVTQVRGESGEQEEETLDGVAHAAMGEGEQPTTTGEGSTMIQAAAHAYTPWERAKRWVDRLRARGVYPVSDGDVVGFEPARTSARVDPLTDAELAEGKSLKPSILLYLARKPDPDRARPASDDDDPVGVHAPPVPKQAQAAAMAAIEALPGNPDRASVATAAAAIAAALGDDNPVSMGVFTGLAHKVRAGAKGVGCLIDPFEAACGRKVRDRGKMFIDQVKRWIATAPQPRRSGGRPPSPS